MKVIFLEGRGYIENGILVHGLQGPYISSYISLGPGGSSDLISPIEMFIKNERIIEGKPKALFSSYIEVPRFYIKANTEYNLTHEPLIIFGSMLKEEPEEYKNKKIIIKSRKLDDTKLYETISIPKDEKWILTDIRGRVIQDMGDMGDGSYQIVPSDKMFTIYKDEEEEIMRAPMYILDTNKPFSKTVPTEIKKKLLIRIEKFGVSSLSLYLMFILRVEK